MADRDAALAVEAAVKEADSVVHVEDPEHSPDVSILEHGPLAELAKEEREHAEWLDILGNQSLLKKVLRPGEAGARPVNGQSVSVHYDAWVMEPRTYAGSTRGADEGPYTFVLGDGDAVTAFDLAVSLMELGEKAIVKSDSRFAYGSLGWPPLYPPNANVEFEIELVGIEDTKLISEMTLAERMQQLSAKNERGKFWFSIDNFDAAANSYKRALNYLPKEHDALDAELLALKCTLLLNLATTYRKSGGMDDVALDYATRALEIDGNNIKALFRTAQIHLRMNNHEEAIRYAETATRLEPGNPIVRQLLDEARAALRSHNEKERAAYKNLFASPAEAEKPTGGAQVKQGEEKGARWRSCGAAGWVGGACAAALGAIWAYYNMGAAEK